MPRDRVGRWFGLFVAVSVACGLIGGLLSPSHPKLSTGFLVACFAALVVAAIIATTFGMIVPLATRTLAAATFVVRLIKRDPATLRETKETLGIAAVLAIGVVLLGAVIALVVGVVRLARDIPSGATLIEATTGSLDRHPYVALYLLGCVVDLVLNLVHVVLFFLIGWVTKANILAANLRKLETPVPLAERFKKGVRAIILDVLFSWLGALGVLWNTTAMVLRSVREAVSSVPESVKQLRFPLKNNADLPAESVWAYLVALRSRGAGEPLDETALTSQLENLSESLQTFDKSTAIRRLRELDIVEPAIIAALLGAVEPAAIS
jgi:hypothetical protein